VPYYEASARKNVNVAEVFEDVLRQIIRQKSHAEEERRMKRQQRKGKRKCVIV
jgi:GTPase SAR1 family protein